MKSVVVLLILSSCIGINEAVEDSLVFVYTIFRHGDRTPETNNLYPTSQYYNESFFMPYGFGQLTNKGKLTAFKVGQELRERYKGFLDETYNIKLIDARSSDFNRTKASLQVMLAGLFPPTEELVWLEGMNWQPIATTYVERTSDKELFCFGCPAWDPNYDDFQYSAQGRALLKGNENIFEYITNKTGKTYRQVLDVYFLYFGFAILESLNETLPEWSKSVYPEKMANMLGIHYDYMTSTPILRQMAAGYLLKEILEDIDDKISDKFPVKKMSIICGHENNIAALLRVLDINEGYNSLPPYGGYILFELHRKDSQYGIKIFYQNYKTAEPKLMKLPECQEFCPLEKFKQIVEKDIPVSDEVCRPKSAASGNLPLQSIIIFVVSSIVIFNSSTFIEFGK
ncbi:unnamed protein product [Phaedon cochleariae]|uniref:acid phosphatase n=1 Tax=Phaedon cochleariae TaxID=80249 RepID=A0A9P0DW11_PHACE|nr:unnamed protein product [Phaedon cochleariae]